MKKYCESEVSAYIERADSTIFHEYFQLQSYDAFTRLFFRVAEKEDSSVYCSILIGLLEQYYFNGFSDDIILNGRSLLHDTVKRGKYKMTKTLLKAKFNPNLHTPIAAAIVNNDIEMVRLLLNYGADANLPLKTILVQQPTITPIELAAMYNRVEVAMELQKHGVDLGRGHKSIHTPLTIASLYGNVDMVKFLVEQGVDVNDSNVFGETAVFLAARSGVTGIIPFLHSNGANINSPRNNGTTPISVAIVRNHLGVVDELCSLGVNTFTGIIHFAVNQGNKPIIVRLLQAANKDISSDYVGNLTTITNNRELENWFRIFQTNKENFDDLLFTVSMDNDRDALEMLKNYTKSVYSFRWAAHLSDYMDLASREYCIGNAHLWPDVFNKAHELIVNSRRLPTILLEYIVSFCDRNWFEEGKM